MSWSFAQMAKWFSETEQGSLMMQGTWGLERETPRVNQTGELALTEHPAAFGDKLKNEQITTDFSESQLEFITPPRRTIEAALNELRRIQQFAESAIGNEWLWPFSMPPKLPEEEQIPLAKFNDSALGKENEIYRKSLAIRYGRKMQMISGLHCNFSFHHELLDRIFDAWGNGEKQPFINELYMAVARNFLRYRWLLVYLFGASPVADDSYRSVVDKELDIFKKCCPECACLLEDSLQYATSLRVSRFGYSSTKQHSVSFNSLNEYIQTLKKLLETPSPEYKKLGIYDGSGQIQLNDHMLQKESEFYSSIRLKTNTNGREKHLEALQKHGVGYMEIRIIDINPFEWAGVSEQQLKFLHLFLLFCLFNPSPPISHTEWKWINENHHRVSLFGRMPNLKLIVNENEHIALEQSAKQIFHSLFHIASLADRAEGTESYTEAVEKQYEKCTDRKMLPSSIIVQEMADYDELFVEYGMRIAKLHKGAMTIGGRLN